MLREMIGSFVPIVHGLGAESTSRWYILRFDFPVFDEWDCLDVMEVAEVLDEVVFAIERAELF